MSGQNGRVRIDKEKNVALRYARAGVPHGCNVAVMDRQDDRARGVDHLVARPRHDVGPELLDPPVVVHGDGASARR
jgi:hypothetical protein